MCTVCVPAWKMHVLILTCVSSLTRVRMNKSLQVEIYSKGEVHHAAYLSPLRVCARFVVPSLSFSTTHTLTAVLTPWFETQHTPVMQMNRPQVSLNSLSSQMLQQCEGGTVATRAISRHRRTSGS